MLESVEWGEFRIGDLFEKIKVNSLKYKTSELPDRAVENFTLPALTAGIQNQGLNNFVPKDNATILRNVVSISANGANTGATFYQSQEFTVLQDAYAIRWKDKSRSLTDKQYLYLISCISKTIFGNYEWTYKAGWERIKTDKIQLPTKNNQPDYDFMQRFIEQLQQDYIQRLNGYLEVTGLKNTELTEAEQKALVEFESWEWGQFKVIDIFNVKNTGNILSRDIVPNSGNTPYLCASAENNAVSSYISYDENYLDKGDCIFIGGKTFVVTYQEKDFFSNDSHNLILALKDTEQKNKFNQFFLATCVNKSLSYKYSWGDSISNRKIQKDIMTLPTTTNQPDYAKMQTLISAIQKLVIRDVVQYANGRLIK